MLPALAAGAGACVEKKALESQVTCPCAADWTCDNTLEVCVKNGQALRDSSDPTVQEFFERRSERKLDVLFVVDDSLSMMPLQTALLRDFDAFTSGLQAIPGGLPDLHVAVVTTDGPTGAFDDVPLCMGLTAGKFVANSALRGNFITATADGTGNNFDGQLADIFRTIALVGENGCGLEQPLGAAMAALDPAHLPAGNAGFLRDDAYLAVIVLTNEDDCSMPATSDLANDDASLVPTYGVLGSYRCNRFGHLCGGAPPPADMAATGLTCTDNDTSSSKLVHVNDFVSFFRALKPDPSKFLPSIIAGPPAPYDVTTYQSPLPDGTGTVTQAQIEHSCVTNDVEYADPGVRLSQFIDNFPATGVFQSICAPSFTPILDKIAATISRTMESTCVQGFVLDRDATTPGLQAACAVTETGADGQAATLPSCNDNGNVSPCWTVVTDTDNCPVYGKKLVIYHDGNATPEDTNRTIKCETCADSSDPRCK